MVLHKGLGLVGDGNALLWGCDQLVETLYALCRGGNGEDYPSLSELDGLDKLGVNRANDNGNGKDCGLEHIVNAAFLETTTDIGDRSKAIKAG